MPLTPRQQALNDEIVRLSNACILDGWASYIEAIQVPDEIAAALTTGRPELLALIQPRTLDAVECSKLYDLLRVLITTNMALQQHAQQLSQLVDNWMQQFSGLHSVANQIEHFANFRKPFDDDAG